MSHTATTRARATCGGADQDCGKPADRDLRAVGNPDRGGGTSRHSGRSPRDLEPGTISDEQAGRSHRLRLQAGDRPLRACQGRRVAFLGKVCQGVSTSSRRRSRGGLTVIGVPAEIGQEHRDRTTEIARAAGFARLCASMSRSARWPTTSTTAASPRRRRTRASSSSISAAARLTSRWSTAEQGSARAVGRSGARRAAVRRPVLPVDPGSERTFDVEEREAWPSGRRNAGS